MNQTLLNLDIVQCPNCKTDSPDGTPECGKCGLIFAKWKPAEERMVMAQEAAVQTEQETGKISPLLKFAAIAAILLGLWEIFGSKMIDK